MIILNGEKLNFTTFPNGETKVDGEQIFNVSRVGVSNAITFKYENDSDLIKLMFVKYYLDERLLSCTLTIAYMPYSRMDRVEGNSVFTLKYVSDFINNLLFDHITVIEPHSDVTCALLNRSIAYNQTFWILDDVIKAVEFNKEVDYLFFPDAGAQKRYGNMKGYKQLVGFKKRNFATGEITSLDVVGDTSELSGKKVIIIDDLCSYGGTFYRNTDGVKTGAAQKLKELGASEIYLVVAHCENSIFKGSIFDENSPINKVFTTNTILGDDVISDSKINVYGVI